MTDQQRDFLNLFRILGPLIMFFAVLGIGHFVLGAPLVLVVVVACLFAIIEYVTLTWLMRRGDSA